MTYKSRFTLKVLLVGACTTLLTFGLHAAPASAAIPPETVTGLCYMNTDTTSSNNDASISASATFSFNSSGQAHLSRVVFSSGTRYGGRIPLDVIGISLKTGAGTGIVSKSWYNVESGSWSPSNGYYASLQVTVSATERGASCSFALRS